MQMSKFIKRRLLVAIVLVGALLALAFANRSVIRNTFDSWSGADYVGNGTGSVVLQISQGDDGAEIAQELVDLGVVKTFRTIYKLIIERNVTFYPGNYSLKLQMSSPAALDALANPDSRISNKVTIREGLRIGQVLKALAGATGVDLNEFTRSSEDLKLIGVPEGEVSAEGWLFPATYEFDPGLTASQILQIMVDRTKQELNRFGVEASEWHRVLTLAALVQKEARLTADFYKAARVFQNRIDLGMHLQSDATVSYGVDGSTVSTSAADRSDPNRYNTYKYLGLPIGPIGAPGSVAIDAALNPAPGKWLFFCTVNLKTGETVFTETHAEHQKAVRQWLAWMKENPGYE
jgi:UPF0755 protein